MSETTFICLDCGAYLTDEEAHYYSVKCEDCVRAWSDRVSAWIKGSDDIELDQMFDAPPRRLN